MPSIERVSTDYYSVVLDCNEIGRSCTIFSLFSDEERVTRLHNVVDSPHCQLTANHEISGMLMSIRYHRIENNVEPNLKAYVKRVEHMLLHPVIGVITHVFDQEGV